MTVTFITLALDQSPQDYNLKKLGRANLQIVFKIENKYYLLGGKTQDDKLTTLHSTALEDATQPFFVALAKRLEQETFGVMKLIQVEKAYQLQLADGSTHALSFMADKTLLTEAQDQTAQVSFTAVCESLNLEQLEQLAKKMNPTAQFWHKIGAYLSQEIEKLSKDKEKDWNYAQYWVANTPARDKLIADAVAEANILGEELLVKADTVFLGRNTEHALKAMHHFSGIRALETALERQVGPYSERSSYSVIDSEELLYAARQKSYGLIHKDMVTMFFTKLNDKSLKTSLGKSPHSIFAKEEGEASSPRQKQQRLDSSAQALDKIEVVL